jgi:hypothetical protein
MLLAVRRDAGSRAPGGPMASTQSKTRSGWVTFAGILILIAGAYNVVWGYAALDKKELFAESRLIYDNLEFWGVLFLIVGVLQLLTAILLFLRRATGLLLAVIGASTSAVFAFFALLSNTDWALTIIALDILVLWCVLGHFEDFEEGLE